MIFDKIVESCSYLLDNCPVAKEHSEYLNARLSKKYQKLFQFGYYPKSNNISLISSMVGSDCLTESKLMSVRDYEDSLGAGKVVFNFFENHNLIMPYKDVYGETIAVVGRTIMSDRERKLKDIAKYKNTVFNKGNHLFGLYYAKHDILKKNSAIIVEGQFDAIKAYEMGMSNVVALGGSNMTDHQFALLSRYTDNINLLLDDDEPGHNGRKKIKNKFGHLASIKDLFLPKGFKDLDEWLCCFGEKGVDNICEAGMASNM